MFRFSNVSIAEYYGIDHFQRYYYCGFCNEDIFHFDLQKHLQSENHRKITKEFEKYTELNTMKQVTETKKINSINCPFCKDVIGSDIANTINEVNGQWQCNNGHTFLVQYLFTIKE